MLKAVKLAVLRTAKKCGLFEATAASEWRRRRLLILCYHGFSLDDEHLWDPALYITPGRFRERLTFLRDKGYNVLPLAEGLSRLRSGTLPARAVAITVDDGTYDFYSQALPILNEFRYPATLYLSTYYVEHQEPVFDGICEYMQWKASRRVTIDAGSLSGREKSQRARELARELGIDYGALTARRVITLMTAEETAEAARRGIDVQLHTHRHRTPSDERLFAEEIHENRVRIERMTGAPARHFCYPSGVARAEFLPWLRKLGVESATTCEPGIVSPASDLLLLPRLIDTSTMTWLEFEAWLTGCASFLPRRG